MSSIQSMRADAIGKRALADMILQTTGLPKGVNQSIGQSIVEAIDNTTQVINSRIGAGLALEAKMRQTLGGKGGLSDSLISLTFGMITLPNDVMGLISTMIDMATTIAKCNFIAKGAAEDYKGMCAQIGRQGTPAMGNQNPHFDNTVILEGAVGATTWRDSIMPRYKYVLDGSGNPAGGPGTARRI